MSDNLGEGRYEIVVEAEKAKQQLETTKVSFTRLAGASIGLAANIAGITFAFDALNKTQTRINSLNLKVEKAQERVNKMFKEGKATSEDFRLAVESLRLTQERAENAANDLTQSQIGLALNLTTMAAVTLPTFISLISKKAAVQGVATVSTALHTKAIVASSVAIRASTLAMLFNPLTAAAVGIAAAAAVALLATNTFGLRDALFGVTDAVDENTKALGLNDKELDNMLENYKQVNKESTETTRKIEGFTTGLFENADAIAKFTAELRGEGLRDVNERFQNLINIVDFWGDRVDQNSDAWKRAMASLVPEVRALAGEFDKLGKQHVRGFIKEMLEMGVISKRVAKELRESFLSVRKDLDDVKKNETDLTFEEIRNLQRIETATLNAQRNISKGQFAASGLTIQAQLALTARLDAHFQALRASGNLSQSKSLHGNLSSFGGITQAQASALAEGQLFNLKKAATIANSTRRRVGVSTSGDSTGSGGRKGRRGGGPSPVQKGFSNKLRNANFVDPSTALLAEFFGIEQFQRQSASFSPFGRASVGVTPEAIRSRWDADLSGIQKERDLWLSQVEAEKTKRMGIASQLGLSFSELLVMQSTKQGALDVEGMLDYQKRRLMISSGVN